MDLHTIEQLSHMLGAWADCLVPIGSGVTAWPDRVTFSREGTAARMAAWIDGTRSHIATIEMLAHDTTDERYAAWVDGQLRYGRIADLMIGWELYWLGCGRMPRIRPKTQEELRHARSWIRHQAGVLYTIERAMIQTERNRAATP